MANLSPDLLYLCNSLKSVDYNGSSCDLITIRECGDEATLKKITLRIKQGDWLCFSPDTLSKGVMSPILKVDRQFPHNKSCDAVILIKQPESDSLNIYYIDLKSGNPVAFTNQFKSTRQFVRYFIGLYNEFKNKSLSIGEEKYLIFYDKSSLSKMKQKTAKPEKITIPVTTPNKPYKHACYNDATLLFHELLA